MLRAIELGRDLALFVSSHFQHRLSVSFELGVIDGRLFGFVRFEADVSVVGGAAQAVFEKEDSALFLEFVLGEVVLSGGSGDHPFVLLKTVVQAIDESAASTGLVE